MFPQDVYDERKIENCKEFFKEHHCKITILKTNEIIDKNVPYNKGCLLCKDIRRTLINKFILENNIKNSLFITGHTSLDLLSYYIEMMIKKTYKKDINKQRYLEVSNKFYEFYQFKNGIKLFRPLTKISYMDIDSYILDYENSLSIIKQDCYWIHQRKRLIQKYIRQEELQINPDTIIEKYKQDFRIPSEQEFNSIPIEIYLL